LSSYLTFIPITLEILFLTNSFASSPKLLSEEPLAPAILLELFGSKACDKAYSISPGFAVNSL
jgi:hypothetical protein